MSTWPISPLTPRDLDFAVVNYDFTGLTAGEMGDLPQLEATIDSLLADFGRSIADQTVLLASTASDLDDLGNVLNEMSTDDFDQVLADLAGIAATGDGLLGNLTSVIP